MRVLKAAVPLGLLLAAGCQRYQAQPLNPSSAVADVQFQRTRLSAQSLSEPEVFTFSRAVALFRDESPALKDAAAEYATALALARVKTPLPNPSIEAGPNFGFGPDANIRRLEPFGSIGFSIPTGKRLKRQDELNRAQADLAGAEAIIRQRELYFDLRRAYSRLVLGHARLASRTTIAAEALKSADLSRKLVEAGQATTLDAGLIKVEYARIQTELLGASIEVNAAKGELAQLIGISKDAFARLPENPLSTLPEKLPPLEELNILLVNNNTQLARFRAKYEVAERELRLEIAKQYPDFRFGPTASSEVGDKRTILGLTLGIDLPLFDYNQQAVATAFKRREEIKTKYESAANRVLADVERAFAEYQLSLDRLRIIKETLLPQTQANIDIARKLLEAGATDSLKFLETSRSQRSALIEAIDTELSARSSLIFLEQSVGVPLFLFPEETPDSFPRIPQPADSIPSSDESSRVPGT